MEPEYRDLEADIALALERGGSPFSVDQVFRALWRGELRVWIGERMSASAWVRDGAPEIVHVCGRWDRAEANWMLGGFKELERQAGAPGRWSGRAGWVRFLEREAAA